MDGQNYRDPFYFDAPFYHYGMTDDEYECERMYLNEHVEEFIDGRYMPLWKQLSQKRGKETRKEIKLYGKNDCFEKR